MTQGQLVEFSISPIQVLILKQGLNLEIRTWNTSRAQLTKESSLHAFTRLTGINPGRGIKGREYALAILEECEAQLRKEVTA
jgi:hypothetical protein